MACQGVANRRICKVAPRIPRMALHCLQVDKELRNISNGEIELQKLSCIGQASSNLRLLDNPHVRSTPKRVANLILWSLGRVRSKKPALCDMARSHCQMWHTGAPVAEQYRVVLPFSYLGLPRENPGKIRRGSFPISKTKPSSLSELSRSVPRVVRPTDLTLSCSAIRVPRDGYGMAKIFSYLGTHGLCQIHSLFALALCIIRTSSTW